MAEKSPISKREEEILKFWKDNKIFEKSLDKPSPNGNFVFYDGPPFATGLPHYGHILAGTLKDVVPRYQTMRGKYVRRVWGWDTHGLPIESLIQKELGVETKKDIEELGIEKFNEAAKASVFRYDEEWRKTVPRTGRWVDMDNQYTTMDSDFTESVWWGFKELHKKGLVYESFKTMHVSPLLETTLSNFEVNQGYKDITDISVYVKFELVDEPGVFLLAWTTTPWTLPGNVALAVGEDIKYVKAKIEDSILYVAKELAPKVFKDKEYEIVGEVSGKDLVGKSYKPVFDYYSKDTALENHDNGWKIYGADFVTTEDGTGIVHIAPAFGEDDLNIGKETNLPFIQHVNIDGTIKPEVTDLAGRQAKPKATESEPNKHQETDIEIIKLLAGKGTLFAKEKIIHSYPHCWRTDAPLLNYAMSSWFIKVTDLKNKLISENKKVSWVPKDIKEGRFGKWLLNARDWAISRNRYWGTSIPIWRSEDGTEIDVIGSFDELQEKAPEKISSVYFMRHGYSEKNENHVYDSSLDSYGLLKEGVDQAKSAAKQLKKEGGVDVVISSPVRRCRETAEIVAKKLGIEIEVDDRLAEVNSGKWEGTSFDDDVFAQERQNYYDKSPEEHYVAKRGETGESWQDVGLRGREAVKDALKKYPGKKILFVTHAGTWGFTIKELGNKNIVEMNKLKDYLEYAAPHKVFIDTKRSSILDLHRPFIDEITYEKNGKQMKRIEEVFDGWVDSGSMPFAQVHYPFENKKEFEKRDSKLFPADFIAEGLDQTRGWFYTLLVLGVGLFKKSPYKNVIVNGLILAEDGKKMSKSLNNYPDVGEMLDKYGADAMRFYMLNSPVVKSEPFAFSEKGVDEVVKKISAKINNVYSLYEMYTEDGIENADTDKHVLDRWIVARARQLSREVTLGLEGYELDKATRPFLEFVDDFSTWYIRRSRDRFKSSDSIDRARALRTTQYVLRKTSKLLAPFMPFLAEDMYMRLKTEEMKESVHLEEWPSCGDRDLSSDDKNILEQMRLVRESVSLGLELRAKSGIKVRQPLQSLTITEKFSEELNSLIKDEVNVKEITVGESLDLNTEITPMLQKEGDMRELVRGIQGMRKDGGLNPEDEITLVVETDKKEFIEEFKKEIETPTNIKSFEFSNNHSGENKRFELSSGTFTLSIK